jgi:hypothetical protein
MKTHVTVNKSLYVMACLGWIGLLVGCQARPSVDVSAETLRWEYQEQMILATRAIQADRLEQAKVHLAAARAKAFTFHQERKVESLERLIAGAEALRSGNGEAAREHWARIADPTLNSEVRSKAKLIGIDVPMGSVAQEGR